MAYLPFDLMTNDVKDSRRLKVESVVVDLQKQLAETLITSESTNKMILEQLRLLNNRFEEAFNTGLNEVDND